MPSKEKITETYRQHKINAYSGTVMVGAIGYLAGAVSLWFLPLLIIPAFGLWASVTWLVRGGFMLAMVMNEKERLEEMRQWIEGPVERALMEKRKNGARSGNTSEW